MSMNVPMTTLTVSAPDPTTGIWGLALTCDADAKSAVARRFGRVVKMLDDLLVGITLDTDSDPAAAGEHAANSLLAEFGVTVGAIVYPDGQTVVCGSDPESALMEMSADELFSLVRQDPRLRNNNCIQDSVARVAQARVGSQYRERMRVGLVGYIAHARQTEVK